MTMEIITTARVVVPGFHRWPSAPPEVFFLKNTHRHLFHVSVSVLVTASNERPVEFFMLQHCILDTVRLEWGPTPIDFGDLSCEMIAEKIYHKLNLWPHEVDYVTVSEDGENSGTVRRVYG